MVSSYISGYYSASGMSKGSEEIQDTILTKKHPAKFIADMHFDKERRERGQRKDKFRCILSAVPIPEGILTKLDQEKLEDVLD